MWALVLVWAVPLMFWAWSWRGASSWARWWVGNELEEMLVRGVIPAWVLLSVSVFIQAAGDSSPYESAAGNATFVGVCVAALLFLWTLSPIPLPRWWAPAWFRDLDEQGRRPRTRDAFDAVVALSELQPSQHSSEIVSGRLSSTRRLGSWRGNWVYDPDSLERAHGLTGRGSVEGRLTLLADGIVFAANRAEDSLRGKPTVVEIRGSEVTGSRVVPARAGADGVPRRGVLYRSLWPRVVVDTNESAYVFEVMRAGKVAAQIRSALVEAPR